MLIKLGKSSSQVEVHVSWGVLQKTALHIIVLQEKGL